MQEHVAWSGLTRFDLDRPRSRMSMYRTVLAEGQHDVNLSHLHRRLSRCAGPRPPWRARRTRTPPRKGCVRRRRPSGPPPCPESRRRAGGPPRAEPVSRSGRPRGPATRRAAAGGRPCRASP
ncbi:hypothetical protein SPAR_39825 [Streptomyces sparsogenes DSM 40356]|uniref:Uncharacterized protein n=1 Tax=Streptomyces sparsogenes DSM 40356 TaxID=1331668 RepID=A0A1R1S674_9ACTN|nr:hypothetical protein SPAR_39825 [Streptomyces sparsogenes DSM 40356]